MEMLDVINENDEVIGQATREECHKNPLLLHRTVHFTLVNQDTAEILMTQGSFLKTHDGGKYCVLGEHVMAGESFDAAIIRGFKEELGISVSQCKEIGTHKFVYDQQSELVKFYIADYHGETLTFPNDEIEGFEWVKLTQLHEWLGKVSDMTAYWLQILADTKLTT
jgi:isopentenyldiphosphate isomerase